MSSMATPSVGSTPSPDVHPAAPVYACARRRGYTTVGCGPRTRARRVVPTRALPWAEALSETTVDAPQGVRYTEPAIKTACSLTGLRRTACSLTGFPPGRRDL